MMQIYNLFCSNTDKLHISCIPNTDKMQKLHYSNTDKLQVFGVSNTDKMQLLHFPNTDKVQKLHCPTTDKRQEKSYYKRVFLSLSFTLASLHKAVGIYCFMRLIHSAISSSTSWEIVSSIAP